MFLGYSELLNALDSGSTTKLTICNKQVNRQAFEDTVLLPQRGDSLDGFVDEFNGMLESKISGSSASVEQDRFITVSVHKKNVDEARTFFSRVTGEVSSKLSRLNSSSNELDAAERLDVLRGFFRPDESSLPFDLQSAMKRGHNLKDTICPDSLEFHRDYFKMGNQYGRVLFLKDYASYIKDSMILELTDLNRRMMLSIDMIPVPTDEAVREVENKLLGVETNVTNWQRRQNSNQNFSAVVPYDLEQQRKETREMLDDLTTRDQRMLFAVVTLVHLADSKKELDKMNHSEYPLTSRIRCSECGAFYHRKVRNGTVKWVCSRHAADTASCDSHYYSEARIYDGIITMVNKLRFCEEDILGQTIQKLEFAAAAYKRNNRAASQLSQSIAELNAKLLALERLRTKGYLAADIYHTQAREIRQQLDQLKTERYSSFESKILTMLEDVRKLKSLIDELEQPLEAFEEKLFHEIVTDICINNHDEMTVTLLGGLKFTELI